MRQSMRLPMRSLAVGVTTAVCLLSVPAANAQAQFPSPGPSEQRPSFPDEKSIPDQNSIPDQKLDAAAAAGKDVRWFVIDAIPISNIDVNGLYALRDLNLELEAHGTTLIFAGRRTEFLIWLREIGLYQTELDNRLFPSLTQALKAYRREILRPELPPC